MQKSSQVNICRLTSDLMLPFSALSGKEPISIYFIPRVISVLFPQKGWVCFLPHRVVAVTICYLSQFRTLLRPRLRIYIDNWVMRSINRANITFPWYKFEEMGWNIVYSNICEKINLGDSQGNVPSVLKFITACMHARMHCCFLLSSWEIPQQTRPVIFRITLY